MRGEEAAGGDLSKSMEEDITFDNEIATALLCARGDASTIDGDNTATITTAYTDSTGDYGCEDFESHGGKACRLTPAAGKRLEANLKKEQVKVMKLLDMNIKVKFDLQAAKLSLRNLKEKHTNALAKKDNGEYFVRSIARQSIVQLIIFCT